MVFYPAGPAEPEATGTEQETEDGDRALEPTAVTATTAGCPSNRENKTDVRMRSEKRYSKNRKAY